MPNLGWKSIVCGVFTKTVPFWIEIQNLGCLSQNSPVEGGNSDYGVLRSKAPFGLNILSQKCRLRVKMLVWVVFTWKMQCSAWKFWIQKGPITNKNHESGNNNVKIPPLKANIQSLVIRSIIPNLCWKCRALTEVTNARFEAKSLKFGMFR